MKKKEEELMKQIKAFMEKANQDKELMEKLEAISNISEAEYNDAIIALATEYGFTIATDEIEELSSITKPGEISEEQLEAVTGGGSRNRYCSDWCRGLTERRTACTFPFVWCDHYRETYRNGDRSANYYDCWCAMDAFPPYVLKKEEWGDI